MLPVDLSLGVVAGQGTARTDIKMHLCAPSATDPCYLGARFCSTQLIAFCQLKVSFTPAGSGRVLAGFAGMYTLGFKHKTD